MKKKRVLEADLDPPGAPPRPGAYTAERALALTKRGPKVRKKSTEKSRPGAYAAARVVDEQRRRKAGK